MSVIWTSYNSREEWLSHRIGLGASESGAICGYGFKTPLQLWKEKIQAVAPQDLSDNPRVQFGNDVEEPLRALFRVMYPEYQLDFKPYTILRRDDHHRFMFSTPDGWLTERETGRKGLYESKSSLLLSAAQWAEWKDQVPMGYYCQLLHSMFVGDFDFAILFAILRDKNNDAVIRHYRFERAEVEEDIRWVVGKEEAFYKHIENGTMPPQILTL
jgi:putative phage-type endonuclease